MPTGVHLAVVSGAMIKGVRFLNRQGVHVRSNPHRAGSGPGTQRAHHPGAPDAPVNLAAERLQPLRNEFRGALLLEAQFRMGVNVLPPLGQLPVVFEDLHVLNIRTLPAVCEFTNPAIHHAGNFSF